MQTPIADSAREARPPAPGTERPAAAGVPFMDLTRTHGPLHGELVAAFDRVLGANAFILGGEVERFEEAFAAYCGAAHCIGVNSGTAALAIALMAAGIGPGDEVIVPAHTFIASALSVMHAGATPVCADVEQATGLIDPAAVADAITPRTAAIVPVHLYGQACAMDELHAIADPRGIAIFEDAAQAHGARHGEARAGALGTAASFSFYPSKNLGALGDGGAITTDDAQLAAAARRLRDLGRFDSPRHDVSGFNERLDGVQAAALRVKLDHLDAWNDERRAHAARYAELLDGHVELLEEREQTPAIYHLFPIRLDERAAVAAALGAAAIGCGVHYPLSLPEQPALAGLGLADAPRAREWAARELSLPIFPGLRPDELEAVAGAVREAVGRPR